MKIRRFAVGSLLVLYPAMVFVTLRYWELAGLGYLMIAMGMIRLVGGLFGYLPSARTDGAPVLEKIDKAGATLVVLGVVALITGETLSVLIYPVVINATLLFTFAMSLGQDQSTVERLARLRRPNLPEYVINYTRTVTIVWCVFFALNMVAAAATALYGDLELWTLYNGAISYLLAGILMAIEWLVRQAVRRRHEGLA
jgi:uncharacterized membrane protein